MFPTSLPVIRPMCRVCPVFRCYEKGSGAVSRRPAQVTYIRSRLQRTCVDRAFIAVQRSIDGTGIHEDVGDAFHECLQRYRPAMLRTAARQRMGTSSWQIAAVRVNDPYRIALAITASISSPVRHSTLRWRQLSPPGTWHNCRRFQRHSPQARMSRQTPEMPSASFSAPVSNTLPCSFMRRQTATLTTSEINCPWPSAAAPSGGAMSTTSMTARSTPKWSI